MTMVADHLGDTHSTSVSSINATGGNLQAKANVSKSRDSHRGARRLKWSAFGAGPFTFGRICGRSSTRRRASSPMLPTASHS